MTNSVVSISFVTVNYNNDAGLKNTLSSYLDFKRVKSSSVFSEILVIDGGSSDDSLEVINSYLENIDYYVSEADDGIYNAMQKGVEKSSGDYISFMNSGDCIVPENFAFFLKEMVSKDFVYAGRATWDSCVKVDSSNFFCFFPRLLRMPNHQAMIFPKKFLLENPFQTIFGYSADLDHKLIAYKKGILVLSDVILANCESGGVTQTHVSLIGALSHAKSHYKLAKKHYGFFWGYINFIKCFTGKAVRSRLFINLKKH